MMLLLQALAPTEGIGIVRVDESLRLVRPPYLRSDSPVISLEALQDALLRCGFCVPDRVEFETWEGLIGYLREQIVACRRALGTEIPASIAGVDILDMAPPELISSHLDRLENTLIPGRMFEEAESFLLALLESGVPDRDRAIARRAAKLLRQNKEARERAATAISGLGRPDLRFPTLAKSGKLEESERQANGIRERGSVFAFDLAS